MRDLIDLMMNFVTILNDDIGEILLYDDDSMMKKLIEKFLKGGVRVVKV